MLFGRGMPVPADREAVVFQLLSKNPADRPALIGAADAALRACGGFDPWTDLDAERWWEADGATAGQVE